METPWDHCHLGAVQFCSFSKVNELGQPRKHNATKPKNAWWRWMRSGQRNPPVLAKQQICTAIVTAPCRGNDTSTSLRKSAPSSPWAAAAVVTSDSSRSEEHTSELQSQSN